MGELTCDGCGKVMGYVDEDDLSGSSFACSIECAKEVMLQVEKRLNEWRDE